MDARQKFDHNKTKHEDLGEFVGFVEVRTIPVLSQISDNMFRSEVVNQHTLVQGVFLKIVDLWHLKLVNNDC